MDKKIRMMLEYGIMAPSGHNSQPWKFKIDKNTLTILPDYSRIRTMVDPDKRELFISIGALVKNVELAASKFKVSCSESINGDTVVMVFENLVANTDENGLFEVIKKRRTYRDNFTKELVNEKELAVIGSETSNKCFVEIISDKKREELAKLVLKSDLIWFKSRDLMEELAEWMRDDSEMFEDGMPTGMISMYKVATDLKYMFSSDARIAKVKAKRDYELAKKSPVLAVLVSNQDNIEYWIEAGKTFQVLALKLTQMGLACGLMNSAIELNGQRMKLNSMLNTKGYSQMLMRIGYPENDVLPTPRRKLEEFLV